MKRLSVVWLALGLVLGACSTTTDNSATDFGNGAGGVTGTGCDQSGGFGLECNARLDIFEKPSGIAASEAYAVDTAVVTDVKDWSFSIRNNGNGNLLYAKVEFVYAAKAPSENGDPAFTCTGPGGAPCSGKWPGLAPVDKQGGEQTFSIRYKKFDDGIDRTAVLRLTTNAKDKAVVTMKFSTASGAPRVLVTPPVIDFDYVEIGAEKVVDAKIFNTGSGELVINVMDASSLDAERFAIILEGKEYAAGAPIALEPPLRIAQNSSVGIKVLYRGKDDLPHVGALVLQTNDPTLTTEGGPGFKAVPVKANSTGPCLLTKPSTVVFGATGIGSKGTRTIALESCGDEPVLITSIVFGASGPGEFGIDFSKLAETGGKEPSAAAPLTIPKNGTAMLTVTYEPEGANPVKDGLPVPDLAELVFETNTPAKTATVGLEGVAASSDCPTAIITIQEGDTVVPQTVLHLDGLQSIAPAGGIAQYKWEVTQPQGSVGLFMPVDSAPQVTFEPNVAGEYIFRLRVWDQGGKESCFPGVRTVKVLPDQAIHVELLWDTPGDPDQSDSGPAAGADLDLHFAHPYGSVLDFDNDGKADPWFDAKYDCFWFNKNPEWGSYDPNVDDNPSLDRDDTDGAGPENLNLTLPEDGMEYAVGVHYYDDHGWGPSKAEVRIYIFGQLAYQVTSQNINQGDMWYVADIAWPSANVAGKLPPAGGGNYFVTSKYPAPEL
ncbi:MAG: hypothetical protein RIT45_435 [Pseudomonadota bacterium]|jgi:hypothetical protein